MPSAGRPSGGSGGGTRSDPTPARHCSRSGSHSARRPGRRGAGRRTAPPGGRDRIAIGQVVDRREVPPWDGQQVGGSLGADVAEHDHLLVLEHPVRGDLLRRDPAEQALGVVGRVADGHARSLGEVAGSRQDHGGGGHRHRLAAQDPGPQARNVRSRRAPRPPPLRA